MPGVSDAASGLTRQCSHSNDISALSPSSAPSTHKAFSFIRSSSFSFNKSRSVTEPPPIPESDKEPIFDEIRDCDEAPYPLPPQTRKMSAPGPIDIKRHKAEYKSFNGNGHDRSTSALLSASVPAELPSTPCSTVPMPVPPHKHKWLNKLDPRINAKLMEEKQKTIERQERERKKKREDEEMIGELLHGWAK
jgi:hypothetical protein